MTSGRQDGGTIAAVYKKYIPFIYLSGRLASQDTQTKFTIIVPNFDTINIIFNIYMILNSYKSYIVASLFVLSTAVPAVTAEQSNGDLDGGGYRKIPLKVEVFILPRKIVLSYTNDFYPSKWELPVKTGKKRERN